MNSNCASETTALTLHQLAELLRRGKQPAEALQLIEQEATDKRLSAQLATVRQALTGGTPLADALAKLAHVDTALRALIRRGEAAHTLPEMIEQAAGLLDDIDQQAFSLIRPSTYYYATLALFAVLILMFLSVFVIPVFQDLYSGFGMHLPALTGMVMAVADIFVYAWWLVIILLIIGFKYAAYLPVSALDPARRALNQLYFLRRVEALSQQGVELAEAWAYAVDSAREKGLHYYARHYASLLDDYRQSGSLATACAGSRIFSAFSVQAIAVAEKIGDLPGAWATLCAHYRRQLLQASRRRGPRPLDIVIALLFGVLIGLVVIAVYLPIFQMGGTLG